MQVGRSRLNPVADCQMYHRDKRMFLHEATAAVNLPWVKQERICTAAFASTRQISW